MNLLVNYLDFLKRKGKRLSEINPGSSEIALTVNDALEGLELLKDAQAAVLGGDILSENKNSELSYIIHLWGYQYHYLNWYCERIKDESKDDYLQRSYNLARENIFSANKVAKQLNKKCYIVFVVGYD